MATVKYLNSTVTLQYDADDFQYISSHAQKIIDAAQSVGVSIGALAGAMVEEYSSYSSLPRYARELIIDGAAQLFTHEAIAENYALVKSDSSIGDEDLDRIQNVALVDVGASNIKIETAIDIVLGFHSKGGVTSILWTGLASMRSAGGKHHVFEEGSKPGSAGLSVH